ncbi:hypothetical protein J6590_097175 [Homalodisca vitripennis]|nr:hypothetical protein J6590_097175 [Homalodisca vitripennis]
MDTDPGYLVDILVDGSGSGSLLAGLYLPVESTTGHSKNRCATSIWATLWMSSSGSSLTANIEILGFMGNSIGLVYCGRWLLELVGFDPLPQRLLLTSTRCPNSSSWISIGGGPYSLTLPILNILSLRKQRKGPYRTKCNL